MPRRPVQVPFRIDPPLVYCGPRPRAWNARVPRFWRQNRAGRYGLLRLAALVFLFVFLALPAFAQPFEGLPVREIHISGVHPDDEARLLSLLPLKLSQPYTATGVRDSLQRLFATGRFFDIQADAIRAGDGVSLTFRTTVQYFIGAVFVEGIPVPPTLAQQVAATRLELGTLYTHEQEESAKEGLRRLLEENGWYRSDIQVRLDQQPERQLVNIHFTVMPGERARIRDLSVVGSPGYELSKIRRQSGLKAGQEVDGRRIANALARLQRFYQKNHYLEASIAVSERRYLAAENRVQVVFAIDRGAKVTVSVDGVRLSSGKKRQLIPIYQEGAVDADLVREGEANLRNYLQQRGRFEAKITQRLQKPDPDSVVVEYEVEPGQKHEVALVSVEGNHYFNTETLRERMFVAKRSLLSSGRYSPEYLNRDVESIRNLYMSNGFEQVKVNSEVKDDYMGKSGRIAVYIHVDEGRQTLVRNFVIEGIEQVPRTEVLSRVAEGPGQPYSQANVSVDRDTILGYYFNEGFRQAALATTVTPVPGTSDRVDVTYRIAEGTRRYVDHLVISGLENTQEEVVKHQVVIGRDRPISQASILDTQRQLYDLGIFQAVDIAVQNRQGREPYKNVLIQVAEARRWTLQVGAGADVARFGGTTSDVSASQGKAGVSPRVSFDVSRLNFRGRAQTLSLKTTFSTLQRRALLTWEAPRIFNFPNLTAVFSLYYDNRFDVQTFKSTREEGSVALEQKMGKGDTLMYRYAYRRVTATRNTELVSVNLIPLFARPVRVAMSSVAFVRDRRDDPVDAHRGRYLTLDGGVAAHQLGGQASFVRTVGRYSTYHPIGRKLVFARSTQLGILKPFGPLQPVTVTQPDGSVVTQFIRDVPLPERFFSGGGNSLRGFAVNQAGPRDPLTGFPVGGNALFINNVELRFPLHGPNLGGAVFHDMGNVYTSASDISLRLRQKNESDLNYAVHAIGFGVRYKTPIGPVRLDLSYSMNPPKYFGVSGDTAPANGCVPGAGGLVPGVCKLQQLSHFQFFFSIGQTF